MKWRLLVAICTASIVTPAEAQVAQMELDAILHEMTPKDVALRRSMCAMGQASKYIADVRKAGVEWPDMGAWCVTVLIRQGRDRTLGYIRDPRSTQPTSAIAFDGGFVGGYLKRETLPSGAPSMATLLPVAQRCLEQQEQNNQLCSAAGYMLGLRAANGERVTLN